VWRPMTARTSASVMPRALAMRATWYSAAAGLISGSRPEAEVVTRSTGTGPLPLAARSWSTAAVTRSMRALLVGPRLDPPELFAS